MSEMKKCDFCGNEFETSYISETVDGDYICIDCVEHEDYSFCDQCGKYELSGNTHWINDEMLCDNCFDDLYEKCTECGEYVLKDDLHITNDNNYICSSCYDDYYFTCDDCGEIFHRDYANYTNNEYFVYCDDCYPSHSFVKSYDYVPELNFLKDISENLYFGFELEVEGDSDYAYEYLQFFESDEREIFLTEDGSLDSGFEITSQPMTYEYFKKSFEKKLAESLKFLIDRDFKSHNAGGLHVHTSRNAWTNSQLAQLSEIMYGNDNDIKTWLQITQRQDDKLNQWASMRNKISSFNEILSGKCRTTNRYTAVNYTENTIEFRIFNGNLRIERFLKNLECVKALYDFTRMVAESYTTPFANTVRFLRYVLINNSKYPNLHEFITSRNIYQNHINNNNFAELERIAA